MNKYIDLHIHTKSSDGKFSLQEILQAYYDKKFCAIAITDHDTVDGFKEFSQDYYHEMRVIKGVEISCRYAGREVHILGYDIDYENSDLLNLLDKIKHSRKERAMKMVAILQNNGIEIVYEDVLELVGQQDIIGRPHIAQALVKKGIVSRQQKAFDKYIGDNGLAYVPKIDISPEVVIKTIHKAGGFSVIAHPYKSIDIENITYLMKVGLDGVETYYYDHSPSQIMRLEYICHDLGLITTGGSDFHGYGNRSDMCSYQGNEKIINSINERLKIKIEVE